MDRFSYICPLAHLLADHHHFALPMDANALGPTQAQITLQYWREYQPVGYGQWRPK